MIENLPEELAGDEHAKAVGIVLDAVVMLGCVTPAEAQGTTSIAFTWRKKDRYRLWYAVFTTDVGLVEVEPYRAQVRIESERGRDHYYDTAKELAGSIRSRLARQRATQKAEDEKLERDRRRNKMRSECEKETWAELTKLFGKEIAEAAFDVTAYVGTREGATWTDGTPMETVAPRVSVFVSKTIRGDRLTLPEAVRFATVMQTAGYFQCTHSNGTLAFKCPLHGEEPCPQTFIIGKESSDG